MFDIEATKRQLGIETKKTDFEHGAAAIRAIRAIPEVNNSHNSQNSTHPSPKTHFSQQRKACFWKYKISSDSAGFTQMGLITDDLDEAQKQLTAIYGKPVSGLHKK